MKCDICPRKCNADREKNRGYCSMPMLPVVSRAALHFWEEPVISGGRGSGTVFFAGCNLKCVFCQNYQISIDDFGKEITVERLAEIYRELEDSGADNINLVTPTHFADAIIRSFEIYSPKVPVIYNCGGYESIETLERLDGSVNVYLPDIKYFSPDLSGRFSKAPDYFKVASAAVERMVLKKGVPELDEKGLIKRGVLIRHLVLPGHSDDSIKIMDWIYSSFGNSVPVSLMRQYTPYRKLPYPELNRRLTTYEYEKVLDHMLDIGLTNGYMQEKNSAKTEYTPIFDLTGVE